MKLLAIIKDSLRYPLSNVKFFMILGVLFLSNVVCFTSFLRLEWLIFIFSVLGALISVLCVGYFFKVIETSLEDSLVLPSLNSWKVLLYNGVKVFIVMISYLLPAIIIGLYLTLSFMNELFTLTFGNLSYLSIISIFLRGLLWPGIFNVMGFLYNASTIAPLGIWALVAILYILLIMPIIFIAIGNMINAYGDLQEAFNFHGITTQIFEIGFFKLFTWYIFTSIFYLALLIVDFFIENLIPITPMHPIYIIWPLIFVPYFYLCLVRSLALLYMS